jgi:GAF domain
MNHFSSSQSESESDMLTHPLYSTTTLVTALTPLLISVCDRTEWEYGESWIPDATCPVLELSPAWCITADLDMNRAISWMQFQVCSKSFVLRSGEGLPGRVWRSQQPEWLEDVSAQSETYFLRNHIARALSVKAGFGIPIMVDTQVLAVVVFFMSKGRSPDSVLIEQTKAIVRNFNINL